MKKKSYDLHYFVIKVTEDQIPRFKREVCYSFELVDCKDCKHWNDCYRECHCPNWNTGTDDYFVTPAGFYCGWAERR